MMGIRLVGTLDPLRYKRQCLHRYNDLQDPLLREPTIPPMWPPKGKVWHVLNRQPIGIVRNKDKLLFAPNATSVSLLLSVVVVVVVVVTPACCMMVGSQIFMQNARR